MFQLFKKKIAVCMIVTGDYAFSIATTAQGLLKHHKNYDFKFHIYHDGISDSDQILLKSLLKDVEYHLFDNEYYHQQSKVILADQYDQDKTQNLLDARKFYFIGKIFALSLLAKHSDVLYLDTDLLIVNKMDHVFSLKGVAWRESVSSAYTKLGKLQDHPYFYALSIDQKYSAPNAGVMWFTNEISYKEMLRECLWMLQEHHTSLRGDLDEAVISWACFKYKVNLTILDEIYNHWLHFANNKSVVLHAIGNINFWEANFRKLIFPEWLEYYNHWLKLGGSNSLKQTIDQHYLKDSDGRGQLARTMEYMLFWEGLYSKLGEKLPHSLYRSGPLATSYSQLFIRGLPKYIHYELGITGNLWAPVRLKFFVKHAQLFNTTKFNEIEKYIENSPYMISPRRDFFEIYGNPLKLDQVEAALPEFMKLLEKISPDFYQNLIKNPH